VLVLGAGRLGQLIAQTLVLTGCNLHIAARYSNQRKLLARRNINIIDEHDLRERFYDVVVEATGSPKGFDLAHRSVRPRGKIVLKSTFKQMAQINVSSLAVDEITLVGSRCGPFSPALDLIEKKLIDPTILIESRYPLDNALDAFKKAAQPGVLKVLLQMV
jgi:threonine dehydrogenase-like Zn-dependent dehydrogenase